MINILSNLMKKVVNVQEQMDNVNRWLENYKKESKENARNQKHCNRNEECPGWAHQQTGHGQGKTQWACRWQQKLTKWKSEEKKKWKKLNYTIQELQNNCKRCNIHIMGAAS